MGLEKILEEIDNHAIEFEVFGVSDDYISVGWVKDVIRKYMNDGWIPVDKGLPPEPTQNPEFEYKNLELYLVSVRGSKYPFRAFWNGVDFTDGWMKCDVVAWQPLPEPYRPEKGE